MKDDLFEVRPGAYIFNNKNQLLLLKNRKGTWGIVGGHLHHNEELEEGLKREIKEETGLDIKLIAVLKIEAYKESIFIRYVAISENDNIQISEEHQDFKWIGLDSLEKYELTFKEIAPDAEKALKIIKDRVNLKE